MVADGLPDVVELDALPARVTIYEVGPRDGLQNEAAVVPVRSSPSSSTGWPTPGTPHRGHQLRAPALGSPAGRRRGAAGRLDRRPAGPLPGAGAQRPWAGPGAGRRGPRDRGVRLRHRDLRPEEPEPDLDESLEMFAPVVARAREPACGCGGTCRCASATRGRARCRSAGGARGPTARARAAPSCRLGDTIGVGTPARCRRCCGAPTRRHRLTRSPCTSTTPTARPWPTRWPRCRPASRSSTPRPAGWWLPVRRERHRQPGHRGPGLAAGRARHRDRGGPGQAGRHQRLDGRPLGRPSPSRVVQALAG